MVIKIKWMHLLLNHKNPKHLNVYMSRKTGDDVVLLGNNMNVSDIKRLWPCSPGCLHSVRPQGEDPRSRPAVWPWPTGWPRSGEAPWELWKTASQQIQSRQIYNETRMFLCVRFHFLASLAKTLCRQGALWLKAEKSLPFKLCRKNLGGFRKTNYTWNVGMQLGSGLVLNTKDVRDSLQWSGPVRCTHLNCLPGF